MNQTEISLTIAVCGFVFSILGATFVAGTRWGKIESTLEFMNRRLEAIEGLFKLRLTDHDKSRDLLTS